MSKVLTAKAAKPQFAIVWTNPATKEVSYLKGELLSFYWERGYSSEVILFGSNRGAETFASERINVPYAIWELSGVLEEAR
jgi:hypothetical protein